MELNEEVKEKIEKLPTGLKSMSNYLLKCLDNIINGECNEETVASTLVTLNENVSGRVGKEDVVNTDKALDILGLGRNNNRLRQLTVQYGIKQVVINNQKCGFLRSDIMALKNKLNNEYRKREMIAKRIGELKAKRLREKEELERIRAQVRARRFR